MHPRLFPVAAAVTLAASVASAQTRPAHPATARPRAHPAGPSAIGHFEDWTAATNTEAGQSTCYAFTRATGSTPALPGRGDVVLTVTERQGSRDVVAISAGFAYSATAGVTMTVDQTSLEFYTNQRSAFARDGHAVVAAFGKGARAVARSPGPHNASVSDTFSLKGFAAAYAAIEKACPAK